MDGDGWDWKQKEPDFWLLKENCVGCEKTNMMGSYGDLTSLIVLNSCKVPKRPAVVEK